MQLSQNELELISDKSVIEQKRAAVEGMVNHFHQLAGFLFKQLDEAGLLAHDAFDGKSFKVTRGENFHGYPFVVLDTPRLGGSRLNLAMRTLFWWGHHFSFHFISDAENILIDNNCLTKLSSLNSLVYKGEDRWDQNASSPFFVPLTEKTLAQTKFLKLCVRLPLNEAEKLEERALAFYQTCLELIQAK